MQWAQSQIIGYEMARLNPACQEVLRSQLGVELNDDSHALELLGSLFAVNRPAEVEGSEIDERLDELSEELTKKNIGLDDEALRRAIVRLLLSTSADSSVWRFPLSHALSALNYGEVDDFFKPARKRRRGQSYKLDWTRADAIMYVHYLVGKGLKKHVALARVAKALAVSPETLRSWEQALESDDWFCFRWEAAMIAGQIEESPERSDDTAVRTYDGVYSHIAMASSIIRQLTTDCSLPRIKERLRKYHE